MFTPNKCIVANNLANTVHWLKVSVYIYIVKCSGILPRLFYAVFLCEIM